MAKFKVGITVAKGPSIFGYVSFPGCHPVSQCFGLVCGGLATPFILLIEIRLTTWDGAKTL